MTTGRTLTAGKWTTSDTEAAEMLGLYLGYKFGDARAQKPVYAWPHYDGFRSSTGPSELDDGDLLTPVLLNVRMKISGFAGLKELQSEIQARLIEVPEGIGLQDADESHVAAVAQLFALLDTHSIPTVSGTTLSKVLHRKRPHLIPLHDRYVNDAYVPNLVPAARHRTWETYITLLMRAMRDDLAASAGAWAELAANHSPASPRLTPLRALDIVIWTLGKQNGASGAEHDGND